MKSDEFKCYRKFFWQCWSDSLEQNRLRCRRSARRPTIFWVAPCPLHFKWIYAPSWSWWALQFSQHAY